MTVYDTARPGFAIDFVSQTESGISFEGHLFGFDESSPLPVVRIDGKTQFEMTVKEGVIRNYKDYISTSLQSIQYTVDIPNQRFHKLEILIGNKRVRIRANVFTGLGMAGSYTSRLSGLLIRKRRYSLEFFKATIYRKAWFEIVFLLRILFNWRLDAVVRAMLQKGSIARRSVKSLGIIGESIATIPRDILLRVCAQYIKSHKSTPLWLLMDRGNAAGDNAEALLHFIKNEPSMSAKYIFVIDKSSKDYRSRLIDYEVIEPGSFTHKLKVLCSQKIISSHADEDVINPFRRQQSRFVDLCNFDFVFLQHGIIRNDLSAWLNRYEKNISLFVTSSGVERDSILEYPYYYSANQVVLTGLPRHDLLDNKPKRKIILMPTYRLFLINNLNDRYGNRKHDPNFIKSDYFNFYNSLISDSNLLSVMDNHGIKGEMYIHPNFASQIGDFNSSTKFEVMNYPYDYTKALSEGSLFITDYSSVVFDFAYLRKPIVYTQFDKDRFYGEHAFDQADFFKDEDDGFGPVVNSYDQTIASIVHYIENGLVMEGVYKDRVEEFFYAHDKQNSKRVFDAIVSSDRSV